MTTFLTSSLIIFWGKKYKKFALFLPLAAIILTFSYFRPSEYFSPDDDYFLNRFFANRTIGGERGEVSKEYDNYSEDYLLLPTWVKERPSELPTSVITSDTALIEEVDTKNSVRFEAEIVADEKSLVEINKYYFPGWNVEVDGELVEVEILKPHGNMGIWVEEGSHIIEIYWQETPLRRVFDAIGLISLSLIIFLIMKRARKSNVKN